MFKQTQKEKKKPKKKTQEKSWEQSLLRSVPIALGIFKLSAEMNKQKGKLQFWGNEGITQTPASLPPLGIGGKCSDEYSGSKTKEE